MVVVPTTMVRWPVEYGLTVSEYAFPLRLQRLLDIFEHSNRRHLIGRISFLGGAAVNTPGSAGSGIWILYEGRARLIVAGASQPHPYSIFLNSGDVIGVPETLVNASYNARLETITSSTFGFLGRSSLRLLLACDGILRSQLIEELSRGLTLATRRSVNSM